MSNKNQPYVYRDCKVKMGYGIDGQLLVSATLCGGRNSTPSRVLTDEERLLASVQSGVARTRRLIRSYGYGNEFEYFATFTFPAEFWLKDKCVAEFTKWMRKIGHRHGVKIEYLIEVVPNEKEDYHVHALLKGIPQDELYQVRPHTKNITKDQRESVLRGCSILKWKAFDKKYGTHHELQRFGSPDINLQPVKQEGKVLYMMGQYNNIPAEKIRKWGGCRICASRGLKKVTMLDVYMTSEDAEKVLARLGKKLYPLGTSFVASKARAPEIESAFKQCPSYAEGTERFLLNNKSTAT